MEPFVDTAIPIVTFLMMIAVGHGLTASDLRRSATDLRAVITATLGQLILLPLIATVIVLVFDPAPAIIAGLILVAACPGRNDLQFLRLPRQRQLGPVAHPDRHLVSAVLCHPARARGGRLLLLARRSTRNRGPDRGPRGPVAPPRRPPHLFWG